MESKTQEITLKLVPLDAPSTSVIDNAKADHDAWLNNDNTSLVDSLYQTSQEQPGFQTHTRIHRCDQLSITTTSEGYQLETGQGMVVLQQGDIITLKAMQFLVTLQTHTVSVPEKTAALPQRKTLPIDDDIWSSNDTRVDRPHLADPFSYQRAAPVQTNTPMPMSRMPLPNIPMQANYGVVEASDPLGFLYSATHAAPANSYGYSQNTAFLSEAQFVPPQHNNNIPQRTQANVLHDLGINEQHTVLARREYTAGKATYLEQSPLDMLDEYLRTDEVPVPQQPAPTLYQQPIPSPLPAGSYYAPTIHDEENHTGALDSVKRFFLRKKTENV